MYIFKTQKTTLFTLNVTFRYQLYQTYILYICIYIYIYIYIYIGVFLMNV